MSDMNRRDFLAIGTGMVSALVLTGTESSLLAQIAQDTPPLPTAMIGLGRQGRALLGELGKFPFVKVKALCDVVDSRLQAARRRAQDATGYLDYRELLDKENEVKAVFIATPSHLHKEIAVACVAAGKHVYCEAPLATTIEDCKAIAQAAQTAPTVFHVGLQWRSNPIYDLARTFVVSGSIRDVVSLRAQWNNKTSWRTPASDPAREREVNWHLYKGTSIGLEGELGIHQFDVVTWFLNKLPESVSGTGRTLLYDDGREIPDTVHCTLTWPGWIEMSYQATLANSYGGRYEELMGTMGAVRLIGDFGWLFKEADAPTQGWEVYAIRQNFHKEEGITLIADATKLAKQGKLKEGVGLPNPPLYYGIEAFLVSVTGNKPSAVPAALGLRASVIGIKAHEAVMTGAPIRFEEDWFKV
ncbi:MAG: Gfo/Idh/MocA family oxidoreductase [Planctomycetota bacterium]